jgi:putative ABC transport system permease protein
LALVLAVLALPLFNDLANKDIVLPFFNPIFWAILLVSVVVLGLFSGSYPAFFMSRFIPVNVLKGGGQNSVGGGNIRNSLVVFQFAISVFLIISTLVVYQQLKFIQSKDLGFSKDQVLVVNDVYTAGPKANSFKEQVKQLGFVINATLSSFFPTPSSRSDSTFVPEEGLTDQESAVSMQTWGVDYDYVPTMGFELVAGRNFDQNFGNDSTAIIVNETAVKVMKLTTETALGERYSPDFNAENPEFFTIIGVVKDFHFESMKEEIDALSLRLSDNAYAMAIKIEAGNFENAVAKVENVWNNIVPGEPFNY